MVIQWNLPPRTALRVELLEDKEASTTTVQTLMLHNARFYYLDIIA